MAAATLHLRPTAPLAERALLPGDPGRALLLAQALLDEPRMFNHHRGLWGYTGTAPDGAPLTVQATGIGGPSAAVVLEELARLGLRRAVRVGTGVALDGVAGPGDLVAATEVLGADGTSRALGAPERQAPDAALTAGLAGAADHAGLVVSSDVFYEPGGSGRAAAWAAAGALAVDLPSAALLAVGAARGVAVACVLALPDAGEDEEAAAALGERLGRAGLAALDAAG